MGEAR